MGLSVVLSRCPLFLYSSLFFRVGGPGSENLHPGLSCPLLDTSHLDAGLSPGMKTFSMAHASRLSLRDFITYVLKVLDPRASPALPTSETGSFGTARSAIYFLCVAGPFFPLLPEYSGSQRFASRQRRYMIPFFLFLPATS